MARLNDLFKRSCLSFLSYILTACLFLGTAVTASAATPDGFEAITINADILQYMFSSGDITIAYKFSSASTAYFYDLANDTRSTYSQMTWQSTQDIFNITDISNTTYFWAPYFFTMRTSASSYDITVDVSFPFPYRYDNSPITFYLYTGDGADISNDTFTVDIFNDTDSYSPTFTGTFTASSFDADPFLVVVQNTYPDFSYWGTNPFTVNAKVDYSSTIDTDFVASSLTFNYSTSAVSSGSTQLYCTPAAFGLNDFTAYVPAEIAPAVEEYLDLIVNPSPESQARVDELKDKFNQIDSDLNDISNALDVEKPDISNSIGDLPADVIDNNVTVSNNVMRPLLEYPLVVTIFTSLFAFVALKLILYGSGKS